jgi:hypothetical protein
MPIARYDPLYGGKRGAAAKALAAMMKTYGAKRGRQVFYATANKRRRPRRT